LHTVKGDILLYCSTKYTTILIVICLAVTDYYVHNRIVHYGS